VLERISSIGNGFVDCPDFLLPIGRRQRGQATDSRNREASPLHHHRTECCARILVVICGPVAGNER